MNEGTIDGKPYPIAVGERGETLWQTTQVAQEKDEVWDDWSLSMGETEKVTGRGHFFALGFDPSIQRALKLSPFYHNLNNTNLTTAYGYFMEDVETAASTLTLDAYSTDKDSVASGATIQWSHTVASQDERILIVTVQLDSNSPGPEITASYDNIACTPLGSKSGDSGTDVHVSFWFLLNPPTGANVVRITNGSANTLAMVTGAVSLYGVNSDTPFGTMASATGTDGTPTVTASTAAGEFVLGVVGVEGSESFTAGANETERWDAAQSTDVTGAGFTQAGSDGGVISPTLDAKAGDEKWVAVAVPIKPASTTSRSVMWIGDTTKLYRYNYDPDGGLTLAGTQTIASGVCGRPAKMNGKWYVPMGSGTNARRLDDASSDSGWADAGWKANHLATFQQGVQPTLARANSTTENTVDLNADTSGDVGDTWTQASEEVGDTSAKITDLVEAQGLLFVAKEDGLYDFGLEAESRPVIPFIDRGNIDPDNGKGTHAFGDIIFYPSNQGLWRYRIGRGALPAGVSTIRSFRNVPNISSPKNYRHAFVTHSGEWIYVQLNDEVFRTILLQMRLRREGDPEGHEFIINGIMQIGKSKGMGVDRNGGLWQKGASISDALRDIRVFHLDAGGGTDVPDRRGQASNSHTIYFDERNPGRPQDKVQLRHYTVELEGDWDATTSLQLKVWRDNGSSAEDVGDPIIAAGLTIRNWTVGTNDTCYRFRPQPALTTNSSYAPKTSDPVHLRHIVGIRFPEIISIVIPADDGVLGKYGKTAVDVETNLRRLQNQGVVTFRRPGDTTTTFDAEVVSVTDVMYQTVSKNYAHGLKVEVRRWATA